MTATMTATSSSAQQAASSLIGRSGVDASRLEIDAVIVNAAGILLVANVHITSLSTLPGFRHGAMERTASAVIVEPAATGPSYSTAGLEAEPGFQMSYAQAVEAGRKFEKTIRQDWVEPDIDY
jgi:hypothetical protein